LYTNRCRSGENKSSFIVVEAIVVIIVAVVVLVVVEVVAVVAVPKFIASE